MTSIFSIPLFQGFGFLAGSVLAAIGSGWAGGGDVPTRAEVRPAVACPAGAEAICDELVRLLAGAEAEGLPASLEVELLGRDTDRVTARLSWADKEGYLVAGPTVDLAIEDGALRDGELRSLAHGLLQVSGLADGPDH